MTNDEAIMLNAVTTPNQNTKSETPRTDALEHEHIAKGCTEGDMFHLTRELELELAAAKREVDELKRDKERLDWLEDRGMISNHGNKQWESRASGRPVHKGFTCRQAIDNAVKEEK